MAARPEPNPFVVAETALKRLETRPVQFTQVVLQEIAASGGGLLRGETHLIATESRREHPERPVGGELQHHPVGVPAIDGTTGLLH